MGWRDRDWARLRDDELHALYGVDRAVRRTVQTAPEPAATRTRLLVWPLVAAACVAVGAIAYAERTTQATSPVLATAQRGVLYGTPVTLQGTQTACTEIAWNITANGWSCTSVEENTRGMSVVSPPQYQGSCAELLADQDLGRWVCVTQTPLPPEQLPAAVIPTG